jgi:hypothetical protein
LYFLASLPALSEPLSTIAKSEIVARWQELFDELVLELKGNGEPSRNSVQTYQDEWEAFRRCGQLAADVVDDGVAEQFLGGFF